MNAVTTTQDGTTVKIDGITHRLVMHTDHEHACRLAAYCTICDWRTADVAGRTAVRRFTKAHTVKRI